MRLFPGLLIVGVSAQNSRISQDSGIPQYGPTDGDRCLSRRADDAGRYTMKYSHQSYNKIVHDCEKRQGKMLKTST